MIGSQPLGLDCHDASWEDGIRLQPRNGPDGEVRVGLGGGPEVSVRGGEVDEVVAPRRRLQSGKVLREKE